MVVAPELLKKSSNQSDTVKVQIILMKKNGNTKTIPKKPKTKSQKKHAIYRAKTRLGFSSLDLNRITQMINNAEHNLNDVIFIRRQSRRISHWQVNYNGQILKVIYDKERHQIATIWPVESETKVDL